MPPPPAKLRLEGKPHKRGHAASAAAPSKPTPPMAIEDRRTITQSPIQGGVIINVQGDDFMMRAPSDAQIQKASTTARTYSQCLFRNEVQEHQTTDLAAVLQRLRQQYARQESERIALADANDFTFTDAQLTRDITDLRKLGSLTALIEYHNDKQKETGINEARVRTHLADDAAFPKIMDIVQQGAIADTDPAFIKSERQGPLRDLQRRLLPVYHKHAATMHSANRVLLLPVDQLTPAERADIHMANEFHWRAEPGKAAGRPLMDCSNAPEGAIPLNTDATKQKGIERYQAVTLPTLREVITTWDTYRHNRGIQWTDMWMFKADLSNCFNQLHWAPETAKLMGFMLTLNILMLMLTCGFGVAITPMIWGVLGEAMNRKVNRDAPSHTFTYVDDFFGAGTYDDTIATQTIVHDTITNVLGPEGLSVKKNVHAQTAEILGMLVDFKTATIRPKDKAIEKLFFVLFSIDASKPQPLKYWQCLSSLVNLYSQVMHGMRPFVAAITHMTYSSEKDQPAGPTNTRKVRQHHSRPRRATANAQFAIEIWRAIIVVAYLAPHTVSLPLRDYLGIPLGAMWYIIISDASPWRLCAALYHPTTGELLLWTTYRLPYARDIRAQFQCQREYLGHVLSSILVAAYKNLIAQDEHMYYQWITDNTGALQWAANHKCDSEASQYACLAITQLHFCGKIEVTDPTHKAGVHMGEIDTMSRIPDGANPIGPEIMAQCPKLHAQNYWPCQSIPEMNTLFTLLDPSVVRIHNKNHHDAFLRVYASVNDLLSALTRPQTATELPDATS